MKFFNISNGSVNNANEFNTDNLKRFVSDSLSWLQLTKSAIKTYRGLQEKQQKRCIVTAHTLLTSTKKITYQSRDFAADSDSSTTKIPKYENSFEAFRLREQQRDRETTGACEEEVKYDNSGQTSASEDEAMKAAKNAKVDAIRKKILDAALTHVPKLGWTKEAIIQGAEDVGLPSVVHGMFSEGGFALVSHFNRKCNEQLVLQLQAQTNNGQKEIDNLLQFLVSAVRQRLEFILPYKAQWPQALALIAIPQNASTALAQVLTLVDDICYYSGDRSVDFNWYTRRIGLATIMKMTELYMLQDNSPKHANTWKFLKNRMDEAMQLQMLLGQSNGMTNTFQRSFNSAFITARNILGLGYNRN